MPRSLRDVAVALLVALAAVTAAAGPAAAHGQLAESEPADGSTVAAPLEELTLWFTELPSREATFVVTAPDGTQVQSAWHPGDPRPLREPVQELDLVDGTWTPVTYDLGHAAVVPLTHLPVTGVYRVAYESVASDGEQVTGTTSFSYGGAPTQPSGDVVVSPGGTVAAGAVFPAVTAPVPEPTPAAPRALAPSVPDAVAADRAPTDDGPSLALLLTLAVVAVAVAANVVLLGRRRTRTAAVAAAPAPRPRRRAARSASSARRRGAGVSPRTGGARSRRR